MRQATARRAPRGRGRRVMLWSGGLAILVAGGVAAWFEWGGGGVNDPGPDKVGRAPAHPGRENGSVPATVDGAGASAAVPLLTEPPPLDLSGIPEPDPAVTQAIESARRLVITAPNSPEAWGELGMLLRSHGADRAAANACFQQAQRLDDAEPRWPYFLGTSLLLAGDPDAAVAQLRRATDLCAARNDRPDTPRLKLAEALLAQGKLDEAEQHFRRLLRSHPEHARARLGLGRLAHLRGDAEAAAQHVQVAAEDPRTRKAGGLLLAEIRHRQGEREEAAELLAAARSLPDDPPWPDPFEQEVELKQVGRKRSLSVAMALMRSGRTKEAIALLRQTLREDPDSQRATLLLGLAHTLEKDYAAAEEVLRPAAEASPEAPRLRYYLGVALAGLGRDDEAEPHLAAAAKLNPDDAQTHYDLGQCRARLGDAEGAVRAFRDALNCKPASAATHRELAAVLARTGQNGEALEHARQAVRLAPDDAAARRLLKELGGAEE